MWISQDKWDRMNRELARLGEAQKGQDRLQEDVRRLSSLVNRLVGQLSLISSVAMGTPKDSDKMFDPEEMLFLERLSSGGANIPTEVTPVGNDK